MIKRMPVILLLTTMMLATSASAAVLVDCYEGSGGGDNITRGFYVTDFPGSSVEEVNLFYTSTQAGERTIRLTMRAGTYDGPVIGTAEVVLDLPASTATEAAFMYAGTDIEPGSTVTFIQELVDGEQELYYSVSPTDNDCPVFQTSGTTPPLDTPRRDGIRVRIVGPEAIANVPVSWSVLKRSYH